MRTISLLFALAMALASPTLARADDPTARVRDLVKLDTKGDWTPIFANKPTALMRANFSPAFNEAWETAMKRNSEFPVFDADPLTGVQSSGGALIVVDAKMEGTNVVATIGRKDAPSAKRKVVFVMEPFADGKWLIGDILYPDNTSLRTILARATARK
jgi:hypothetical protein